MVKSFATSAKYSQYMKIIFIINRQYPEWFLVEKVLILVCRALNDRAPEYNRYAPEENQDSKIAIHSLSGSSEQIQKYNISVFCVICA